MFRDKIELKDMDKMDAEYRELLGRVVTIQADCEIGGPHLYVKDILPSAPTKVDQLMVARTAAEEMDHFRKIARVAGDMGVDVSFVLAWPNQKRYLDAFRGIIKTWEDFAIFGFLIDRVGRYQLEEFRGCSYKPRARLAAYATATDRCPPRRARGLWTWSRARAPPCPGRTIVLRRQ